MLTHQIGQVEESNFCFIAVYKEKVTHATKSQEIQPADFFLHKIFKGNLFISLLLKLLKRRH